MTLRRFTRPSEPCRVTCLVVASEGPPHMLHHHPVPVQQEIAVKSLFTSYASLVGSEGPPHMFHHHPVQQKIAMNEPSSRSLHMSIHLIADCRQVVVGSEGLIHLFGIRATSHASPSPGSTGNSRQVVVVGSEGPIHLFAITKSHVASPYMPHSVQQEIAIKSLLQEVRAYLVSEPCRITSHASPGSTGNSR
nr:hypothetical protein Iba_chr13bCG8520 [Ipomoea batatas]